LLVKEHLRQQVLVVEAIFQAAVAVVMVELATAQDDKKEYTTYNGFSSDN
jgi:hypothetical protein